ncbi:LytTR family DNA-binding domain-containing protein [Neolewinella lacunae]|uniref:Response regulator transcription factor n=1 Tax=Neolewinella lacunae TaxID=1517758 RepID=A0A923PN84_9BACT|nr:LytTR family DNA-binding domain-containing protein [Neolewinella lacunae]MBC6995525.1 response regulator transcription factor [Neolewinella lacunae]MDN3635113.1 LytTR family DNA-binding domain-containing protein [Neolewinella lacunae]
MKLTCLIVEDEPMARRLLEQYVDKVASLELLQSLGSPLAALEFLKETTPDVLFLDVQMPEITGIALLKILQRKPYVVLTTAYSEYAIEGYELDVTDYLLKPITFERFLKTVEKITQLAQQRLAPSSLAPAASPAPADAPANDTTADFLFVKDGTKSVRVNFDDVQYIEGLKDYVRIHTPARKVTTLQSLKKLAEMLPADRFIRIHHSYIVAVKWLDEVHRDEVKIGDELLPISNTYRKEFRQFIEDRHLK